MPVVAIVCAMRQHFFGAFVTVLFMPTSAPASAAERSLDKEVVVSAK